MPNALDRARAYLGGEELTCAEANEIWKQLKKADQLSLARAVLEELRHGRRLVDGPVSASQRRYLSQQHALLTSKDPELSAAVRHDRALGVLREEFELESTTLDGDGETLGVAGGILKRRWNDLGQLEDLLHAARLYQRGAQGPLGEDAYAHINAAFVEDLLASLGNDADRRRAQARQLRERIVAELPVQNEWFNAASRAEALFGLGRYAEAAEAIREVRGKPEPWELQTTARQLATLAHLQTQHPLQMPDVRAFFEALLPGASPAIRSALVGKVGLALSGGGFRASFYHLGVLARLAELNVLRHVEVLSCVSGGSIIGACYWLALRRRLLEKAPLDRAAYVDLVRELIGQFQKAVGGDLRAQVQPSRLRAIWQLVRSRGALDSEATAQALEDHFYAPYMPQQGAIYMDELPFTPPDHDPALAGSDSFHPGRHNWLRVDKVPVLVLNATTVNTGHAWQFTPTWMGESPWAVHEAADSISRLQWAWYDRAAGWRMRLGRAVAASACVPGVFAPLRIDGAYEGIRIQLVDGGVYDNQGTVSLLALDCNVLLVSDASGQLLFEAAPGEGISGLKDYAKRSMDTLMARVRLANYADLTARRRSGLLRGLMFLHMKAGLDADTVRLRFSQESFEVRRSPLTASGVRKDFQQAIAELRTDLDVFTADEAGALMACGYQMASKAFQHDLARLTELWDTPANETWPFEPWLAEISSTAPATIRREPLLAALREGRQVRL